ncbi:dihydrofolate reductase [Horticoccus luteus]|uniref:Dihydrofolate reductase n=1 Tax=Horticoccus luteus TaxID=2862869 RepID=A0A8F9TWW6_9BACT|nr:dihydrofolate reductase [Horticoccus luteus]QYM79625.1 dihydrofolate reductase [Horticoccus luteus]
MPPPLSLVAAVAANRVIGRDGHLPWSIPEDMRFFHTLTAGHTAVLGRISFATWPRAAEDGRRPIVITDDTALAIGNVRIAPDVPAALAAARTLPGEIFVCGGQRIFEETLPLATRLHLTLIHAEVPGDRFFPEWRDDPRWRETARHDSADAHWRYSFVTLER